MMGETCMASRRLLTLATAFLLAASGMYAQANGDTGTLTGTVLDVSGKAIPGAVISVMNETSGSPRNIVADQDGKFSVPGLPADVYTLEASAPSFTASRRTGVKLAANATENVDISLNVSELAQSVTVEGSVSVAAEMALSQNTLEATSPKSEISPDFIQNFASPIADYTELMNYTPGTWSVNPNGVGLGDSKTYFRGFQDTQYTMQADGIPFEDTNDGSHHSWAFFPNQFISGIDFDRSPGTASSIGPSNFGGTVDLLSRSVAYSPDVRATAMYGSFNTRMLALDLDSGQFGGKDKQSSLTLDLHQMLSDGYQTYNYQKRVAGFIKYQYRLTPRNTITLFSGLVDLWTNTPKLSATRAQIAQFGDNYLMSGDPTQPNYYGYDFYHVQTDFEYIGLHSDLGGGWLLDNKVYTIRYWNKQNYNSATSISSTSATDKLNGYRHIGDTLALSHETARGTLKTGVWFEWAYTDRYQIPSDPRTWVDAPEPNFHEHFDTITATPYIEYAYRVTPAFSLDAGVQLASYTMVLNQYQDNGKTVGCLGGTYNKTTGLCVGGVEFVTHTANYHAWNPSADARYKLRSNWTAYAQFAVGSVIPPSSIYDVTGAQVGVLPNPTSVKTYQTGSVLKYNRWTLDFDGYYSHFQNVYSFYTSPVNGEAYYYLAGPSNTKGVEAESNILIGHGFNLYLNGTMGNAKYQQTGLWMANAPKNTETVGLTYRARAWDIGFLDKRVGPMWNGNGTDSEAVPIGAFSLLNLFFNYTVRGDSWLRGSKIRLGVNNLANNHAIVGVVPASTASNAPASGDTLTLLPARSFFATLTFGYAPRW
jgi:iron complex outermembrane receptor protein